MHFLPIVGLASAVLLAGCSTTATKLPPISDQSTGLSHPGQVIWHDLATRDLKASKAFYAQLFGWEFKKIGIGPREYNVILHRGEIIGGMFLFNPDDGLENQSGEWLVNLSTPDVDQAVATIIAAGGRIIEPARDVPDRGRAAFISDDQDALFVVTQSSTGDLADGAVPYGGWLWNELWTHDHDKAQAFYGDVFGYKFERADGPPNRSYSLLTQAGQPRAGLLEISALDIRPHWLPFIRVPDVPATVVLAKAMQVNVIFEPDPEVRDGKVALLQGPTGEPFVVQSFDFE